MELQRSNSLKFRVAWQWGDRPAISQQNNQLIAAGALPAKYSNKNNKRSVCECVQQYIQFIKSKWESEKPFLNTEKFQSLGNWAF